MYRLRRIADDGFTADDDREFLVTLRTATALELDRMLWVGRSIPMWRAIALERAIARRVDE